MKAAARDQRRDEIINVAIQVLIEKGYRNTSMLDVAKRASASKETLYAWFGGKHGLFEALIEKNARTVQDVLEGHLDDHAPIEDVLTDFGQALLKVLMSDGAIAINRAAISEATTDPRLSKILTRSGRDATLPGLITCIKRQVAVGVLKIDDVPEAAQNFLGLLIADTQVRRLHGILDYPSAEEIKCRATMAAQNFFTLYGVPENKRRNYVKS